MLSVLRQRNFALLLWGGLISQIGSSMLNAALPYYVYATSHSVMASGTAVVSEMLPGILFHTVGGVYADRLPRKLVLAAGNGTRGLAILPLLAVHGPSTLWIVYLVGFLNQTIAALAGPFGNAAIPHVVRAEELQRGNAAFSAASSAAVLIGSPLGGLLLQQAGLSAVVLVDAISFAVPTAGILLINVPLEDRMRQDAARVGRLVRDLLLGWRYVWQNRTVRGVFLVTIVNFLGASVFFVAFTPFVRRVLGGSAEFYSWSVTLQALSGIAGALIMGAVARWAAPRSLVSGSLLFLGSIALAEVMVAEKRVTLGVSLLVGIPAEFIGASQDTLLQLGAEDAYRGRVYGTYATTTSLTLFLGTLFTTLLTDRIGIRIVLGAGALLLLLSGTIALKALPRELPFGQRSAKG